MSEKREKWTPGPWKIGRGRSQTTEPGKTKAITAIGPVVRGQVDSVISPDHNHWDGPYLHVEESDALLLAAAWDMAKDFERVATTAESIATCLPAHSPYADVRRSRQALFAIRDIARSALDKAKGEGA